MGAGLPAAGTARGATQAEEPRTRERAGGACWARCSPGSQLPTEVLAPGPLAGACSYFRKPPGKGRAQQLRWPQCSAPIHRGKRKEPSPAWAHLPGAAQQPGTGSRARGSQTAHCMAKPPQARGHCSPPRRTRARHVPHLPRAPRPSPAQSSMQHPTTHHLQGQRVGHRSGAWKHPALPARHPTSPVQESLPGGGRGEATPHRALWGHPAQRGTSALY